MEFESCSTFLPEFRKDLNYQIAFMKDALEILLSNSNATTFITISNFDEFAKMAKRQQKCHHSLAG